MAMTRPELVLTSYLHGHHSDRLGKGLTGCAACCTGFSCNSLALSLFGGLSISLGFPFCIIKKTVLLWMGKVLCRRSNIYTIHIKLSAAEQVNSSHHCWRSPGQSCLPLQSHPDHPVWPSPMGYKSPQGPHPRTAYTPVSPPYWGPKQSAKQCNMFRHIPLPKML